MFALPGLLALIFIDYLRPQEFFPALRGVPLLHVAAALAGLGLVLDLRLGLSRLRAAPHLLLALLFLAWCAVTLAVRAPAQLLQRLPVLVIPIAIYVLVAHGIQSFRMLQVTAGLVLAICVALSVFGIHQALAPRGCYRVVAQDRGARWLYDGRPCEQRLDCQADGAEPGANYVCENVGFMGRGSIQGRVRWVGTMEDPNELSLTLGIALPFAFAFFDRRRSLPRLVLLVGTAFVVGLCAIYTRSRGGQIVFATVLAAYFIKRVGWWRGLAAGAVLSLPLLLLGGRSGGEASTMERIECWWTGLHLLVGSPAFGVGSGQFTEYHYLTAHNAYILSGAELGLPGMLLWTSVVYVATKIPIEALRQEVAPVARTWALALLASMAGLLNGIMHLSYVYKDVLWIYVGLTGVLYQAIKRHDPGFRVDFGLRDLGLVALIDSALLFALIGYTGLKLGW